MVSDAGRAVVAGAAGLKGIRAGAIVSGFGRLGAGNMLSDRAADAMTGAGGTIGSAEGGAGGGDDLRENLPGAEGAGALKAGWVGGKVAVGAGAGTEG